MFKRIKYLSDKPKFSLVALLLFALIFTATGVYLIYVSLASDVYDLADSAVSMPADKGVYRIWGEDRYATAIGVSKQAFPLAGNASCVVIVNGESWPDAAIAGSLAGACNGPILLASKDSIDTNTINEIKRLAPKNIYMVGGTAVLYTSLENILRQTVSGVTVKRISGVDRYQTSIEVAKEVASLKGGIPDRTVFVVTGQNFPDALTVGSVSALKNYPIIYADADLSPAAATFLDNYGITKSVVVGGTAAVSNTTYNKLHGPVRITGADRYQTSYNFAVYATKYITKISPTYLGVAYGGNYPDALTAGPALAKMGSSVLILDDTKTMTYVSKFIGSYKTSLNKVFIFGGSMVISDTNYLTYANNMGADYSYRQVKTQELLDVYVRYCPLLAGSLVDYGDSRGYEAVAQYKMAEIIVHPNHTADLSRLIFHEVHHIYDYRDGDNNPLVSYKGDPEIDWLENIPRDGSEEPTCLTSAKNAVGVVSGY